VVLCLNGWSPKSSSPPPSEPLSHRSPLTALTAPKWSPKLFITGGDGFLETPHNKKITRSWQKKKKNENENNVKGKK